jgi:hypothetical protein
MPATPLKRKDGSGGKQDILKFVPRLHTSDLSNLIYGLVDKDNDDVPDGLDGIFILNRYNIENYLIDPLVVAAVLRDRDLLTKVEEIDLRWGVESLFKTMKAEELQKIADHIIDEIEPSISGLAKEDKEKVKVLFKTGQELKYPKWIIEKRGKYLLRAYIDKYNGKYVNHSKLFYFFKRVSMIPADLADVFVNIQNAHNELGKTV